MFIGIEKAASFASKESGPFGGQQFASGIGSRSLTSPTASRQWAWRVGRDRAGVSRLLVPL